MDAGVDPFADPETSEEEIFRATYEALKTTGFAELSIQRIADESTLGKSTIYHHFESKDALLAAFSYEFMEEYLDAFLVAIEGGPLEMIQRTLDLVILGTAEDGTSFDDLLDPGLSVCYLQLRSQAVTDERYRSALGQADAVARERLAALVQAGIEGGVFREVDPDRVAATLFAWLEAGILFRKTSDDTDWLRHVHASASDYLDGIVVDDAPEA